MMKPYNKQEFNRLCAEFLGYIGYRENPKNKNFEILYDITIFPYLSYNETFMEFSGDTTIYKSDDLLFHLDYNWIMEVYNKIRELSFTLPMNGMDSIVPLLNARRPIIKALINGDKKDLVEQIWIFLNWYYENI